MSIPLSLCGGAWPELERGEGESGGAHLCVALQQHVLWAISGWSGLSPCSFPLPTASPFCLFGRVKLFQYHFTIHIKSNLFDIMKLGVIYPFSMNRGLLELTERYPGHREMDAVFMQWGF